MVIGEEGVLSKEASPATRPWPTGVAVLTASPRFRHTPGQGGPPASSPWPPRTSTCSKEPQVPRLGSGPPLAPPPRLGVRATSVLPTFPHKCLKAGPVLGGLGQREAEPFSPGPSFLYEHRVQTVVTVSGKGFHGVSVVSVESH